MCCLGKSDRSFDVGNVVELPLIQLAVGSAGQVGTVQPGSRRTAYRDEQRVFADLPTLKNCPSG